MADEETPQPPAPTLRGSNGKFVSITAVPKPIEAHINALRSTYSKLDQEQKAEILKWKTLALELQSKIDKIRAQLQEL